MQEFDAVGYARWFNENYGRSSYKSLREIAKKVGVSPETISRIARAGEQLYTEKPSRPKIKLVDALSDLFNRPRDEGRRIAGWAGENETPIKKPETVEELIEALSRMGFIIQFDEELEEFTPDDLQDLIDLIKTNLIVKSQRKRALT